ncbi:hypothetical protein BX265_6150 [Streptomyces sp. TLI_235]|nr:hypothetical protein [Streptomyces sp. TLI_235]PBC71540.1 hypothetical protein BX265_6150 [Streptomyces sp. TLI_235]
MTDTPDSPADTLRAAAQRIREHITALEMPDTVRGVPWHIEECSDRDGGCPCMIAHGHIPSSSGEDFPVYYVADALNPELARWIALMHPGVGELIAAWLESTADYCTVSITHPTHVVRALAVARAVLESAP